MIQTDLIAPIPELLRRHAKHRGSKCAYRDAASSVTYAELEKRTANLAGHLATSGVEASAKVAIFLPSSVQWVESCFAINRADAISVPISYESTESEILYRLLDADCVAIVTTDEKAPLIEKLKQFVDRQTPVSLLIALVAVVFFVNSANWLLSWLTNSLILLIRPLTALISWSGPLNLIDPGLTLIAQVIILLILRRFIR